MAFIAKNVIAEMMNTVITASSTRLTVYLSIENNLSGFKQRPDMSRFGGSEGYTGTRSYLPCLLL